MADNLWVESEEGVLEWDSMRRDALTGARLPRTQAWWCTDEVCRWFGAPMFSKRTGKKYIVETHADTINRIRSAWNNSKLTTDILDELSIDPRIVTWKSDGRTYFYVPEISTPARNAGIKGKTVGQAKKKFKEECQKERVKGNSPLGFVVSVKGHILAVSCEGEIVADTAISHTKRKKIMRSNMIVVKINEERYWSPEDRLLKTEDLFSKPVRRRDDVPIEILYDWAGGFVKRNFLPDVYRESTRKRIRW